MDARVLRGVRVVCVERLRSWVARILRFLRCLLVYASGGASRFKEAPFVVVVVVGKTTIRLSSAIKRRKHYVGLQSWFWCPFGLRRGRSLSQVYWACGSGGASLCVVVAVVGSTICVLHFEFSFFGVVRLCVPILSGGFQRNVGFMLFCCKLVNVVYIVDLVFIYLR